RTNSRIAASTWSAGPWVGSSSATSGRSASRLLVVMHSSPFGFAQARERACRSPPALRLCGHDHIRMGRNGGTKPQPRRATEVFLARCLTGSSNRAVRCHADDQVREGGGGVGHRFVGGCR